MLKNLAKEGFIVGPQENETTFLERVDKCKAAEEPQPNCVKGALEKTEKLFGIKPTWVPICFTNQALPFWYGGVTWISEDNALIQMRKVFETKSAYFGIYNRDEIIAHELAHVGRMAFNEPKFEELIAYQSSASSLRKWLASFVESKLESILFLSVMFSVVITDFFLVFTDNLNLYMSFMWLKLFPLAMLTFGVCRSLYRNWMLRRCLKKIPLKMVYHLTDQEIINFSKWNKSKIDKYIERQHSLRWQQLKMVYR